MSTSFAIFAAIFGGSFPTKSATRISKAACLGVVMMGCSPGRAPALSNGKFERVVTSEVHRVPFVKFFYPKCYVGNKISHRHMPVRTGPPHTGKVLVQTGVLYQREATFSAFNCDKTCVCTSTYPCVVGRSAQGPLREPLSKVRAVLRD